MAWGRNCSGVVLVEGGQGMGRFGEGDLGIRGRQG